MRKYLLLLFCIWGSIGFIHAAHIKGGFFTYRYIGAGTTSGTARYNVTLTVYMQCNVNSNQLSNTINFSIFDAGTLSFIKNESVNITDTNTLKKKSDVICISGDERICYYTIVEYNHSSIELPITTNGYIISYQRCCRISGINNILNSGGVGNTFATQIPGRGLETNSSPNFLINDTAVICRDGYFEFPFQATDINSDSLTYSFCSAIDGASTENPAPATADNPPYFSVPYTFSFSGAEPLGTNVTIDLRTGLIKGVAPSQSGEYVISVCVNEYNRQTGRLIGQTRKELHIVVGDCQIADANLNLEYPACDEFTQRFSNNTNSSLINSYNWEFGDPGSGANNFSTAQRPVHTFSDTGVYTIKLVTNRGQSCPDSAQATVRVFPGFDVGFINKGSCYLHPIVFTDTTKAVYGNVNFWRWNFGDLSTISDTANTSTTQWTYPGPGSKIVNLIVATTKGCVDTVITTIDVIDRPPLSVDFSDTLICRNDALQLKANGIGSFNWTPTTSMSNSNTATPTVRPTSTITYQVELTEGGCLSTDTVRVRVVSFVTLRTMPDTVICTTDHVQLSIESDGLKYQWRPPSTVNNDTTKNPIGISGSSQTYYVTAVIGGCSATDSINVTAVPYPIANAGADILTCYNVSVQLNGSHNGSSFTWSPGQYLSNTSILNPTTNAPSTTSFILTSYDTLGCPKPGYDTMVVTVLPKIIPYTGRDTAVIAGQPLQFNASGGVSYIWLPSTGLNSATIANPIGRYGIESPDSIQYKILVFNEASCVDSTYVTVKIFKVLPTIFVPTGFTPDGDGLNDIIAPIAVGIQRINYFKIFNRWGQELFSTTHNGHGWNGKIKGVPQSTNTYVWLVSAVDYLGNNYFQKGTVTLIR